MCVVFHLIKQAFRCRFTLSAKRKMGDRKLRCTVAGGSYTPVDVAAMILRKLCEGHDLELGGPVRDAVSIVSAHFNDERLDNGSWAL